MTELDVATFPAINVLTFYFTTRDVIKTSRTVSLALCSTNFFVLMMMMAVSCSHQSRLILLKLMANILLFSLQILGFAEAFSVFFRFCFAFFFFFKI